MKVKEEHKTLLKAMGLKDKDFKNFDGRFVSYEYDEVKGVRLYDPYYRTSYEEYIDIDGWSAWSGEKDAFMSRIIKGAVKKARTKEEMSRKPSQEEIADALKKKFAQGPKPGKDQ